MQPAAMRGVMAFAPEEPEIQPVESIPLRQHVYKRIEEMIVKGQAKPGDRLPEAELAKILSVSRGPVREALQLLERDGWVEVRPRHGAVVRRRTTREIEDLLEVRRVLEVHAARLAAKNEDKEGRARLKRLLAASDRAARQKDIERLLAANQAVHDAFPELCGNAALVEIVHSLGRRLRWYTKRPSIGDRAHAVLEEHRAIAQAIFDRSPDDAARAMNEHILGDWKSYKPTIAANFDADDFL